MSRCFMAILLGDIPQVATHTPYAPRLPATTLLVVEMEDGGAAQLSHLVVSLVGPQLLFHYWSGAF